MCSATSTPLVLLGIHRRPSASCLWRVRSATSFTAMIAQAEHGCGGSGASLARRSLLLACEAGNGNSSVGFEGKAKMRGVDSEASEDGAADS
ncbi:hypothetical protein MA16_Dca009311 [Dendrobium catenatum]|uniref:Uncharacterized protein n=1 Tax=Dendrobium catenatum TaxID=906689 RepID=A0A2I0WZ10_9ASPA|nr:hypothetical protein MA16_Dca009311 [Dendrobium catenatum]